MTVDIKPSCVQCNATHRALASKGIDSDVVDPSTDAAAFQTDSSCLVAAQTTFGVHRPVERKAVVAGLSTSATPK